MAQKSAPKNRVRKDHRLPPLPSSEVVAQLRALLTTASPAQITRALLARKADANEVKRTVDAYFRRSPGPRPGPLFTLEDYFLRHAVEDALADLKAQRTEASPIATDRLACIRLCAGDGFNLEAAAMRISDRDGLDIDPADLRDKRFKRVFRGQDGAQALYKLYGRAKIRLERYQRARAKARNAK